MHRLTIICALSVLSACLPPAQGDTDTDTTETATNVPEDTSGPPAAEGFVRVAGGLLVNGDGNGIVPRCTNVPGFLDPGSYMLGTGAGLLVSNTEIWDRLAQIVGEAERDQFLIDYGRAYLGEEDFDLMAAAGVDCVRVPLNHHTLVDSWSGGVTFDADTIAMLDQGIERAEATGIGLVLDLHAAPGGQNGLPAVADVPSNDWTARLWTGADVEDNQEKTVALWAALAARYADEPAVWAYDLLNEPDIPWLVPKTDLVDLYGRIIEAIRAEDPNHLILVEGNALATDLSIFDAMPDPNTMPQFHGYWWTDRSALDDHLAIAEALGRPLWLGEFGEATLSDQTSTIDLVEAEGIGWALWPWKRVQTFPANEVPLTLVPPEDWTWQVYPWLTQVPLVPKPSAATTRAAMAAMIEATQVDNCTASEGVLDLYGR